MLKQIIKLLFVALLVSPNVLYAMTCSSCDATFLTGENCRATFGGPGSSCDGEYPGTRFFCRLEDQRWMANIKPPAGDKCKSYSEKKLCPGWTDSTCGCSSQWVFCYNCSAACDGYYLEYNDSTQCYEAKRSELKAMDEGYFVSTKDCKYVFGCTPDNKYYAPEGATISCSEQMPPGTEIKTFHSCSGCEKCEVGTEIFVDGDPGYQQGKKLEFKYVGKWVCGPTGDATENWRCAPGYYKSADVVGADPKTEPNIECKKCPAGTYMDKAGIARSCIKCSDGSSTWEYKDGKLSHTDGNTASSSCKLCPMGYRQEDAGSGSRRCTQCNKSGEYQDAEGQTSCKKCPAPFTTNNQVLNTSKTQCYIDPTKVTIKDKLNEAGITLSDEVGYDYLFWAGGVHNKKLDFFVNLV